MKKKLYIYLFAVISLGMTSCAGDSFTESIFDTKTPAVDSTLATAPFDQWLYDNFTKPYNTEILYRFNLTSSKMNFQLAPSDYKKSQLLAHFIKYLFYDVYNTGGEIPALIKNDTVYYTKGDIKHIVEGRTLYTSNGLFMKKNAPRIFHFIGSQAYSPTTGTETLGYASSGVKITLINVNDMKTVTTDEEGYPTTEYSGQDIDNLNNYQFHTMHHEFSHILHQTKTMPVSFGQVTPASYDGRTWQDRDSVDAHCLGYVTHYASSANTEDFVEVLSCTITDTDYRWMTTIIDACLNGGVKEGDKERVYTLIDSLGIGKDKANDIVKQIGGIKLYKEYDTDGKETRDVTGFHLADVKSHNSDKNASEQCTYEKDPHVTYDTFDDFMDALEISNSAEVKGMNALMKKFEIATKWYTEQWGLYLYRMRSGVRDRQNKVNEYVKGVKIYDLN